MVTFKEILGKTTINDVDHSVEHSIQELVERINIIREAWGRPMIVTSGFRTLQDHLRIYAKNGVKPPNVPMGSQHLTGAAVDIYDPGDSSDKDTLFNWLKHTTAGQQALEQSGLYCEERQGPWQHFQLRAPRSGKRWFYP